MNNLLTSNFVAHYNLTVPGTSVPIKDTTAKYFELKDDSTLIYYNIDDGIARHKNDSVLKVSVINYEAFHNTLAHAFKHGKKICDLIVYTSCVNSYFSLAELTDTDPKYISSYTNVTGPKIGKLNKAMEQLSNTLSLLSAVPDIKAFIDKYSTKKCCFFNKQAMPIVTTPITITAPTSFNRVNTVTEEGFEMTHSVIETLGFKLFDYSGGKVAKIV